MQQTMTVLAVSELRKYLQTDWLRLALIGFLVLLVYFPGRTGPFIADDYPNILQNKGILLQNLSVDEIKSAWSSNTSGVFKRPLANLSFALNFYFADHFFDSTAFKLTNIVIHIANSILVFFLSRLLFAVAAPNYPSQKLAFASA